MLRTLLAFALLGVSAASVAADDLWTPEHVAKIRGVTSTAISPDGQHIAYTLSVPRIPFSDDENGTAFAELHVVDRAGNDRGFITGKVSISKIDWTPDGAGITYVAKRDGDEHASLYMIPIEGGESRRLLAHVTAISEYSLSPDGARVAFLAPDKADEAVKKLEKQGFNAEVYEEVPSYRRIWTATLGDDASGAVLGEIKGQASELHWSPAGDKLVAAIAKTDLIDDHYMHRKVCVIDVASGEVTARFDNPGKLGQIAWSPNGKHIAMISAEDPNDPQQGRLLVAEAKGGALRDVLPNALGHVTAIGWQSDDILMYLFDQGCYSSFEEVKIDGSGREVIVPGGKWVLSGLSLSNQSLSCSVIGQSDKQAPEVFTISHVQPVPTQLTDSNPWFMKMRFARQEVVRYKARDGMEIEGVLVHPLDEQKGVRYPLILSVHGGPEAHEHDGWQTSYSKPGQVAAAKGMAVFYPNYRGSTGRGVAFSKLGQGDYGGAEFDDLIDAVDYFVKTGLVDDKRVGITGGSYGGFATAWCSTKHSHRFAAGVMFVGISDQISKSGSTDIANEMFMVHARKRLWDDWDFFLERSPIRYVEQARTPLLIMHGKDDPRVHPSQSLELYRQLKILGNIPVRLVWYPGEGHGNRKAAARYDYSLRMHRWFDHYLNGDGGAPPAPELEYGFGEEPVEKPEATLSKEDVEWIRQNGYLSGRR